MKQLACEFHRYREESARPLTSLLFVAPMLAAYEAGVLLLGPRALRNGADVWLRGLLDRVGLGAYFLLPLLTCAALLAWHHMRQEKWSISWPVFSGMVLESAAFGMLLLLLANTLATTLQASLGDGPQEPPLAGRLLGYFGAGIYEELLFRLMILPAVAALLRAAGCQARWSLWWGAVATSLMFALAHYELQLTVLGHELQLSGEPFDAVTFTFRALAGGFFTALFVWRGFGIAAGAHALYDIFVAVF